MPANKTCVVEIDAELASALKAIAKVFKPGVKLRFCCIACNEPVRPMTGQLQRFEHFYAAGPPCSLRHSAS